MTEPAASSIRSGGRAVTVAAAMIVLDEERFLGGCLESLAGVVDDIIVVDTGSRDRSVEIAAGFGARILRHEWAGDFAAARNRALDAVGCDWVLYIDADERLRLPSGGRLCDYVRPEAVSGFVRFRPRTGYTRYREWRLFRSDPRIRFKGAIHETTVEAIRSVSALDGWPIVHTPVEIDHLGYDGDLAHKHRRNLPLLRAAVTDNPARLFLWQQLAETLAAVGEAEAARQAAWEGLQRLRPDAGDQDVASASMIRQFLARDGLQGGIDVGAVIDEGLARLPDDHALRFLQGCHRLRRRDAAAALDIADGLLSIDPSRLCDGLLAFDARIFGDKALELAALASLQLGHRTDAARYFHRAAQAAPANRSYRLKAVALGAGAGPSALS